MAEVSRFRLALDMNVLNHLGIGLYSSTPAVVTEIIANAWDADSEEVLIELSPQDDRIEVKDDGHGMDAQDLQTKFLTVGYARREAPGGKVSPKHSRPVMGRKGIGNAGDVFLGEMHRHLVTQTKCVARSCPHRR